MDATTRRVSRADHQLRLAIRALRTAATHVSRARAEFAWGSRPDRLLSDLQYDVQQVEAVTGNRRARLDDEAAP